MKNVLIRYQIHRFFLALFVSSFSCSCLSKQDRVQVLSNEIGELDLIYNTCIFYLGEHGHWPASLADIEPAVGVYARKNVKLKNYGSDFVLIIYPLQSGTFLLRNKFGILEVTNSDLNAILENIDSSSEYSFEEISLDYLIKF